jgi:single-strand DNA-binding protein
MAQGLNKITLIGNLGADPDLRSTKEGRAVLNFRIATTETYQTKEGEKRENTQWHTCVLWGPRGEALSKYLHKGSRIFVEGRMEYRQYEDKDGNKRTAAEVNVLDVLLLDGAKQEPASEPKAATSRAAVSGNPSGKRIPSTSAPVEDDEIPF